MSSLAQQLKAINEKTASVALDRKSRSKIHSRSLIYDPKIASTQDYDYIYQIGLEGLEEIADIDPRFSKFKQTLFSDTTINYDRNIQSKDTLDQLDKNIDAFLTLIGPYYQLSPAIKALEWLVRRFYINIHNAEMLLITALPYHSQPIFVKVLNVIPKQHFPRIFEWLNGYKDLLKSPPASSIIKAFHNDFEIFKLYTMFVIEQIRNNTIYKEQLVFYLTFTVQLLASLSKKLDVLNETYMPIILEAIGIMLLPSKHTTRYSSTIGYDIKLTSYSLIAVLGSVIPLTGQLIRSFTESILQDPKSLDPVTIRHTIIVLGQLWNFYEEKDTLNSFKNLGPTLLTKDTELISALVADNYKINKFLVHYFLATFPNPESFKIFQFINLDYKLGYKLIASKAIESSNSSEEYVRSIDIKIAESLLKSNSALFTECLQDAKLSISALELRLMTTLSWAQDLDFEIETETPEVTDEAVTMAVAEIDLETIKSSEKTFLISTIDEEFMNLSRALITLLRSQSVAVQNTLIGEFTEKVFVSTEASLSFIIRFAFTPAIPLAIRYSSLKFIESKLREISALSSTPLDLYLLIPIFLLGLYDSNKVFRSASVEILRVIKDHTVTVHSNKKKVKSSLLLEDQIYGLTEASKRAIIPPQDAIFLGEFLFTNNLLEDVVLDKTRLHHVLFENLFKSSKAGSKKYGQLILKTFVLNQWSLTYLPVALKSKIWNIISALNVTGFEDRFFFIEGDLSEYFSKRASLITLAANARIDFHDEVEKPIVGLVGGLSANDKNASKEIDWMIQAFESDAFNLQIAVNARLIKVFSSFNSVDLKIKLVNKLIDLLTNEVSIDIDPMETLQVIDMDHDLFVSALGAVQLGSQMPEQGVAKRRRRSSNSTKQAMARDDINNMASAHLKKLTIILDVLEKNLRHGSSNIARPDLLQALFKILTDLDYLGNDGNLPILYAQETLASCMLLSIVKMKSSSTDFKFDSNSIRADLIVNSIRSSQSPQVQNRLLLVIAELASLAPEIILHSVMPIFTFMGAHTVRQDDEFSNSALQQTIAKVIPALAANGSSSLSNEIEFLLTSFVAAFQHIPRHRRVKLFSSLTKTLGYEKTLHALLFLMGQQYVNNHNKNKMTECNTLLEFTTSFLKNFSAREQLEGIQRFNELWEQIPNSQVEPDSAVYEKLSTRSIFGISILSLTDEGLTDMKSQLLKFISAALQNDTSSYNNASSLKIKVALVLLDAEVEESEKQSVLDSFRSTTSFLLSGLDYFTNQVKSNEISANLYELLANFLELLPLNYFVDAIIDSLDVDKLSDTLNIRIARNFAILAGRKFETELNSTNIDEVIQDSVLNKLLPVLNNGIKKNIDIELEQAYLDTFASIVNKFGFSTRELFNTKNSKVLIESLGVITSTNGLLNDQPEIIISSINAINSIVNVLGVKTIGFFPKIVPPALKIWESTVDASDEESAKLLQASIIILLSCLIKKIPAFMASNLDAILVTILSSDLIENSIRSNVLQLIVEHMDLAQVLKSLCSIWNKKFYENGNAGNLGLYLNTMQITVDQIEKKAATNQSTLFMKWLIQAFEFRQYAESSGNKFDNNTIHRLESSFYTCGISFVMKLNDKNFRPLFANLARWAVDGEGSNLSANTEISRLLSFFRFFNKLQEQLKSIITSYFSYLNDPIASILNRFASGEINDINLRRIILNSLTSSFKYDQDDYWSQQGRFETVCGPLLAQLTNIEDGIGKYLVKCITAFVHNVSSDEYNETLVHGLIKYISNENDSTTSNTKIWTVRTLKTIFQKMGEQWLSYLPTLIPYIAELLEDDDEAVEMEVRSGLVRVIENVLGEPLDRYLD